MENRPEYLAMWLGLSKIGIVSALVNTHMRGASLVHSINVVKPKMIIASTDFEYLLVPIYSELHYDPILKSRGELLVTVWSARNDARPNKRRQRGIPIWLYGERTLSLPVVFDNLNEALARMTSTRPLQAHRKRVLPSDLLFYVYTSGTSGLPKAAKIRHMRMLLAGPAFFMAHSIYSHDRLYCPLPVYHSSAGT